MNGVSFFVDLECRKGRGRSSCRGGIAKTERGRRVKCISDLIHFEDELELLKLKKKGGEGWFL